MKRRVDPAYIRRLERELGIDDTPDDGAIDPMDIMFGPGVVIPIQGDPRDIFPLGFPKPTVLDHAEHVRRLASH